MRIDVRVGFERNQFASQIEHVPKYIKDWFYQSFVGEETTDFNEGLLAGFSSAYALMKQMPLENAKQFIGGTVAMLSQETIDKAVRD